MTRPPPPPTRPSRAKASDADAGRRRSARIRWVWAWLVAGLLAVGLAPASAVDAAKPHLPPLAPPAMPDGFHRRVVAEVAGQPVPMATVFEQWGPVWEELADRALRGKIRPEEYEAELQREWAKAVEEAVRDELLYREGRHTLQRLGARMLEQMERQGGNSMPRQTMEARIQSQLNEILREQLDRIAVEAQRAVGGPAALTRHLARRGVSPAAWRERLERRAYIGFYMAHSNKPSTSMPTPQRVRDYYARHKDTEFARPSRPVFRHIFFDAARRGGAAGAQSAAVECWQALTLGEMGFEEAAARYSDDAESRARGGMEQGGPDETRPEREVWLRAVRDAARDEAPGELSGVLESDAGAHLVELIRLTPSVPSPFSEVQDRIRDRIVAEDRKRALNETVRRLMREVPVRVAMPSFPVECGWAGLAVGDGTRPTLRRLY